MEPTKLSTFMRLVKVDEAKREAWGIATAEVVDKANEICDYAGAKKAYQAWSKEAKDATTTAGQEVSLGNVRLQHTMQPVGKVIKIDYQDDKKQIFVGTYIDDDDTWRQIQKGILTGFSHAGDYDFRQCNVCGSDMLGRGQRCPKCEKEVETRYAPVLAELSVVDNPCLGIAHFDYIKADGSHESRPFTERSSTMPEKAAGATNETPPNPSPMLFDLDALADKVVEKMTRKEAKSKKVSGEDLTADCFLIVGDPDKTETWNLPVKFSEEKTTKSYIRKSVVLLDRLKDVSEEDKTKARKKLESLAEKNGVDIKKEQEKGSRLAELTKANLEKKLEEKGAKKGMYQISQFASVLSQIAWLRDCALSEGAYEDDQRDIDIADEIDDMLEGAIEIFLAHAEEETSELTRQAAEKSAGKGSNTMETLDLIKAAKKTLGAHYTAKAAHHTKMAEIAKSKSGLHEKAGEAEGADKAFHKGMGAEYDKEGKAHEKMAAQYIKMAESKKVNDADADDTSKAVASETALAKSIEDSLIAEPAQVAKEVPPEPGAPVFKSMAEADAYIEQLSAQKKVADFIKSQSEPAPMVGVNGAVVKTFVPRGGDVQTIKIESEETTPCGL